VLLQLFFERAEAKEPVLLFHLDEVTTVDRALTVDAGLDRVVVLAADAVQTLVHVLVDVAVVVDRREELLHALVVARFGRADEVVVVDVEGRPRIAKLLGTWRRSTPGRLPVLAAASATFWPCSSVPVRNFVSSRSAGAARQGVGVHGRVSIPDVGCVVR